MRIQLKKAMSLTLAGILAISLAGCNLTGNGKIPEDAVIAVNGKISTVADFNKAFAMAEKSWTELYGESIWTQEIQGKTVKKMLQDQLIDIMVTEKIIAEAVEKTSFKANDQEVQEAYNKFMEALKKNEKDVQYYTEKGIDEAYLKQQIVSQMNQEEFKRTIQVEIEKDATKMSEYEKTYPIQVEASHILVSDEKKAKELYGKVKAGEDFAKIAKENSIDTGSAKKGGSLGFFPRGMMVPEFEKVAFAMKVGEISEPVQSQFGYHIIKIDKIQTLSDLIAAGASKEEVAVYKNTILSNVSKEAVTAKLEELKKTAKITTFPDRIK